MKLLAERKSVIGEADDDEKAKREAVRQLEGFTERSEAAGGSTARWKPSVFNDHYDPGQTACSKYPVYNILCNNSTFKKFILFTCQGDTVWWPCFCPSRLHVQYLLHKERQQIKYIWDGWTESAGDPSFEDGIWEGVLQLQEYHTP